MNQIRAEMSAPIMGPLCAKCMLEKSVSKLRSGSSRGGGKAHVFLRGFNIEIENNF